MSSERRQKWSILEILDWTKNHFESKRLESARLDAEVLLAHVLGLKRVMLYARFDQPLVGEELAQMRNLVARRARGEPVAHLIGRREFWSLDLEVTADTLIPRPDSETLVEVALDLAPNAKAVVDVGTGSGALALALASELPDAQVWALELCPQAKAVATRNRDRLGFSDRIQILQSDLLQAHPPEAPPIDLLVANLPYIPSGDMSELMVSVRDFEPKLALDGGEDGLDLIRRLLQDARPRLAPGAPLLLEAGPDQVPELPRLFETLGYRGAGTRLDTSERPRVAFGYRPAEDHG